MEKPILTDNGSGDLRSDLHFANRLLVDRPSGTIRSRLLELLGGVF
jgi:hypothetical protein